MDNLAIYQYKMKKSSPQLLLDLGYNKYTYENKGLYFYRFPLYKYKKITVIECEIITDPTSGDTIFNVYEKNNMSKYPPFYSVNIQSQYSPVFLSIMDNKISSVFRLLGIVKKKGNG